MPSFRTSHGFAYIALLVVIVIIGISLGAAGRYWSNVVLRDKEEELLFRGDQYRQAIESYYKAVPAAPQYPSSIDDLLMDNRTGGTRRHLRQRYKDPISGEDFVEIRHPLSQRLIGVHSPSERLPLKQRGFPPLYSKKPALFQADLSVYGNDFEDKSKYSEWLFVSTLFGASTTTIPNYFQQNPQSMIPQPDSQHQRSP